MDPTMTTRRTFLTFMSTCLGTYMGASSFGASGALRRLRPDADEALDEALEMLAPYGPSFRGGLSNHGPMTADALISLGRSDAVVGWVGNYRRRLEKRSAPGEPIGPSEWRVALGDGSRSRDWDEWFSNQLAESPWREVVALWIPRLAPGIAAAGLHGVIRAGHAVRSLSIKETELRRDELARALGYWATEYLELSVSSGSSKAGSGDVLSEEKRTVETADAGSLAPSSALEQVELLPKELRRRGGLITSELKQLIGFEPFEQVIGMVDPTAGSPDFMSDLLATFAGTYVNTRSSSFEFLHAVTGAEAVGQLLPHLKEEDRAGVLSYAWQVTAGVFARYAKPGLNADVEIGSSEQSIEELAELAVSSGDEHTIKLVSACAREWRRNENPRLLAAAARRVR